MYFLMFPSWVNIYVVQGHISVKPGHGQKAIDEALEHLKAGHTVMIFPEGLISPLEGRFS